MNLETFYLLFKSDTGDAEKGIDSLNSKANKLLRNITSLAAGFLSFATIAKGFKDSIDYGIDISQASKALNMNVEELDAWGNAVRKTGGSVQGFEQSIKSFADHLGTTAGVALKLLPQLADSFQRLGQFRAMRYGKMLGLDESTILLLQHGRRELDAYLQRQKELGLVTKKDSESFIKFRNDLQDTGHAFRSLFIEISLWVLPIIDKIINSFTDMAVSLRKHSGFIQGALTPLIALLSALAVRFAILEAEVLLPVAAFIALSAAIGLVYDDIKTFMNGGDSLIGRALKRWPELSEVMKSAMKGVAYALRSAFSGLKYLLDLIEYDTQAVIDSFKILERVASKVWDKIHGSRKIDIFLPRAQESMSLAEMSNAGAITSNSMLTNNSSNKNTNVQIGDIQINTAATDAGGIAMGLGNALQDHFRQTIYGFADGVKA